MVKSIVKSWLAPTYELLSGYERSLTELESAVKEDNTEEVRNCSLKAAQYYLKLKGMEGVGGANLLSYFHKEELQEYTKRMDEILNQFKEDVEKMDSIDKKINERYDERKKEHEGINDLVDAGYVPVRSHSKLIEEQIMPMTKKEEKEQEFENTFGKGITKKHEETSDAGYA